PFLPDGAAPTPHLTSFPTRRSSDLATTAPLRRRERSRRSSSRAATDRGPAPAPRRRRRSAAEAETVGGSRGPRRPAGDCDYPASDRKSTRLNSSHQIISYAVFCLKK